MKDLDWNIITTLYRTKNITQTGNILFMSQPALTKRLQNIEKELGVEFLIRTRKGTYFTPEGESIARKARQISDGIQDLRFEIQQIKEGGKGTIRIGSPTSIFPEPALSILSGFHAKYPQYEISYSTGSSHELAESAQSGILDATFVRGDVSVDLPRYLVGRDKYFVFNRDPFDTEDLPAMKLIYSPYNTYMEQKISEWWHERFTVPWQILSRVDTRVTAQYLVRAGLGYAFTTDEYFVQSVEGIHYKPLILRNGTVMQRETWFMWNEHLKDYKPLLAFVDYIRSEEWKAAGNVQR